MNADEIERTTSPEIELTTEISVLERWVGQSETTTMVIDPAHTERVAATFGVAAPAEGQALHPLWHWCFGNETVSTRVLSPDGHPPRGGFLPPVALPRRMWAGGRVSFVGPVLVGDTVTRTSMVESVRSKQGSTGPLIFVTTSHRLEGASGSLITEERDLVYRQAPDPDAAPAPPTPAPEKSRWQEDVTPSETLLFRYSAVTFNSHRIHYDYPYATGVEGYRGLVVHGPLTATLLAGFAHRNAGPALATFSYRSQGPLIAPEPFTLRGDWENDGDVGGDGKVGEVRLWAASSSVGLSMSAQATFGSSEANH